MRLPVDDEIYNVNAVWLGPPHRTLPFRARYIAYAVGAAVFLGLQLIERRIGLGLGFFTLAYSLIATVALTRLILDAVDYDRPVWAVITGFVNEVSAPREALTATTRTFRPARVVVVPSPPGRARRRTRHPGGRRQGSHRTTSRGLS